ncbi:MAG: hypothetical protein P1P82_14115 [Bacteroidales bacterium]|nr:hypothetical protein [Bacteroidales bacterium]MDT8432640.1 hypothetical protein [Bacteroidales bacterium]
MKRYAILLVTIAGLTLSGCLASSLHPFYKMKDKIFDKALVGNWIDTDSSLWVIRANTMSEGFMSNKPDRPDSTYSITYYESKDAVTYLQGTLFILNGQRYVDFFPSPDADHCSSDMTAFHHVPVHTLARMQFKQDTAMFFWFGEEWLNDLFENNRIRINHETVNASADYERHILTAETGDLQKFILKYMNDEKTTGEIENAFASGEETDAHVFLKLFPYDGPVPETK